MSLHKKFTVVRQDTNSPEGEFNTIEGAEKLLAILQKSGIQATIETNDEDVADELKEDGHVTYDIEGLDPVEPENDFGSDLSDFDADDDAISPEDFDNL